MLKQKAVFKSGNELATIACKQIDYHIMGYYPITPSTQISENLDLLKSEGELNTVLIPAEGEHSASGICYGASTGGGRVFSATSANGLMYMLEQLPVQSGTRMPMVLNVVCRTVSGPLSIKSDHSDIMFALNTGWIILFAKDNQEVYDFNIIALRLAEIISLPVIVAFDGFFTSHQKKNAHIFEDDNDVKKFLGTYTAKYCALDLQNPVTIGSYMNEPDLINNKYQIHNAFKEAKELLPKLFNDYKEISGRSYQTFEGYLTKDAEILMFALGSTFDTIKDSVDELRKEGKKVGAFTIRVLRPWIAEDIVKVCTGSKLLICLDRQDSYSLSGGNMSLEIKSSLQEKDITIQVVSRVYGLSGKDFYKDDGVKLFNDAIDAFNGKEMKRFDYYGQYKGDLAYTPQKLFNPLTKEDLTPNITTSIFDESTQTFTIKGGAIKDLSAMPKRLSAGHGACPGCGLPVNINLFLSGIEGPVVLLLQTGCSMVVTTCYPKTSFKVNYVHNLFQNGGATISGLIEMYKEKQRRGELPLDEITFIMVSGDGGLDIGLGSALSACIRNHKNLIILELDNGGYMNTGYQLSYSTPQGAKTSTSHIGKFESGKTTHNKDNPQIFASTNISYVATVSEAHVQDFVKKARKAQEYSKKFGTVYVKALSACPLNWGDNPMYERDVIENAVNCCYHPLYEIEHGITTISIDVEEKGKKIPVLNWFEMMGRTRHLKDNKYIDIVNSVQSEIDRRWRNLKEKSINPYL